MGAQRARPKHRLEAWQQSLSAYPMVSVLHRPGGGGAAAAPRRQRWGRRAAARKGGAAEPWRRTRGAA